MMPKKNHLLGLLKFYQDYKDINYQQTALSWMQILATDYNVHYTSHKSVYYMFRRFNLMHLLLKKSTSPLKHIIQCSDDTYDKLKILAINRGVTKRYFLELYIDQSYANLTTDQIAKAKDISTKRGRPGPRPRSKSILRSTSLPRLLVTKRINDNDNNNNKT